MKILPDPVWRACSAAKPGAALLMDVDGLVRCCIRTQLPDQDNDDALIVLGPFTDNDPGVPWVDFPDDGAFCLDFGTGWTVIPSWNPKYVRFESVGDASVTGAIVRQGGRRYVQVVTLNGNTIVFFDLATGLTAKAMPRGQVAFATKWQIVLPRVEDAVDWYSLHTVVSGTPRQD